jgi:hypothetical protein
VTFELPFHDNFADNYSIIAFADGYEQAGFQRVPIGPNACKRARSDVGAQEWNISLCRSAMAGSSGAETIYFKSFDLNALAPNRIFGYADANLVNHVKLAAQQGEFNIQRPSI